METYHLYGGILIFKDASAGSTKNLFRYCILRPKHLCKSILTLYSANNLITIHGMTCGVRYYLRQIKVVNLLIKLVANSAN